MNLGGRIRELRKHHNITQAKLEEKTGIKREYLSKLENNHPKHNNPTIGTISKIARVFWPTLSWNQALYQFFGWIN